MIRAGARAVDGWAKENGFTVLFCSGNLALREMYENLRDDPTAKLILVDRTRDKAKLPLFDPDLEAHCKPRARLTITLRDFLIEKTDDERWPLLVNTDRNIGRFVLENLPQALRRTPSFVRWTNTASRTATSTRSSWEPHSGSTRSTS